MSDLVIPDDAVEAFRLLCSQVVPDLTISERVHRIAASVVAAELRRFADGGSPGRADLVADLWRRADELDGETVPLPKPPRSATTTHPDRP